MHSLWLLIEQHETIVKHNELSVWFKKTYGQSFCQNFTQYFPYQQLQQAEKRKRKSDLNSEQEKRGCLHANLMIVQQMCSFAKNNAAYFETNTNQFQNLLNYTQEVVNKMQQWSNIEDYQSLVRTLRATLLENAENSMQQLHKQLMQLLCSVIRAYVEQYFPQTNGIAADVLVLLCEIAESPKLFAAYEGDKQFKIVLEQLPLLLLKAHVSNRAVTAMTNLAKQQNPTFLKSLEAQVKAIIKNMQRIEVTNAVNIFMGRKNIINLFYWTSHHWRQSKTETTEIAQLIKTHIKDVRLANYLQYVLT